MFGKISRSLTGSLIIFDCTLLAALSVHISLSLVLQMRGPHCWFPFSPMSPEFRTTLLASGMIGGKKKRKKREQRRARANNLSMIKAAEWKRTLCTMIGAGREESSVVKQITSTQSLSDTAVHGMESEGECSYIPLIITTTLMSSTGSVSYCVTSENKPGRSSCHCIIIKQ